jgi:hypothetical protein
VSAAHLTRRKAQQTQRFAVARKQEIANWRIDIAVDQPALHHISILFMFFLACVLLKFSHR